MKQKETNTRTHARTHWLRELDGGACSLEPHKVLRHTHEDINHELVSRLASRAVQAKVFARDPHKAEGHPGSRPMVSTSTSISYSFEFQSIPLECLPLELPSRFSSLCASFSDATLQPLAVPRWGATAGWGWGHLWHAVAHVQSAEHAEDTVHMPRQDTWRLLCRSRDAVSDVSCVRQVAGSGGKCSSWPSKRRYRQQQQ